MPEKLNIPNNRDAVVSRIFEFRDALTAYAFSLVHNWDAAEDILQETLHVALSRDYSKPKIDNVYYWARQIVHNKAMEFFRKNKRELSVQQSKLQSLVTQSIDEHFSEDHVRDVRNMKRALETCMAKLDSLAVSLIEGFYKGMKSCRELASKRRKSENAVKLALSRIRKRLRECVRQQTASQEAGSES